MSEDFFTPAVRARVVSFILKRKWFVQQTTSQEPKMDFGIDKLLADGTYMASYAPHEVSNAEVVRVRGCLAPCRSKITCVCRFLVL